MRIIGPSGWSLAQKLRWLVIVPPSLAVLLLPALIVIVMSKNELEEQASHLAQKEVEQLARHVDIFFARAAELTRVLAERQRALGHIPDPGTMEFLRALLEETPNGEAQGLYIAFEDKDDQKNNVIQWVDRLHWGKRSRLDYDYHLENELCEWYWGAKAKPKGEHNVSRPYFDEGGANISVVSVTRPIYAEGRFIGVAGVDLDMVELVKLVQPDLAGTDSKGISAKNAYLVSRDGRVFAYPAQRDSRNKEEAYLDLFTLPEGREVASRAAGTLERIRMASGEWCRISWTSSSIPGWKVVQRINEESVFAPLPRIVAVSFGLGFLVMSLMVWILSVVVDWVTGPIPKLTAAAATVEAGDYRPDGLADLTRRRDEFGQLARGFRRMVEEVSGRENQLRQVQDDLSRRERHYRALIENATDIITILGPDGIIRYKSPSVQRILGYKSEELVGRPADEFIHPDDRHLARESIARLADHSGAYVQTEYRFRHKDGSWRVLEAQCSDLQEDRAVGGIVINSRDITERKRDEDEILLLNASLEERVRGRTAELEQKNEELHGAKEATDQAMKQQEDFLSNVAHDLRTPLTIVIGYSEDLLRRARKKGQDAYIPDLKLIVNRGNDLLEMINDLLHLSKAMNDKGIELDLEAFDIAEMVRGRMEGIGTIAQKHGNTIAFDPEPGLGHMVADRAKVWRVLMNLLSNACKFTKDGTIRFAAGREGRVDGEWIVFRISDTGIGMSAEEQSRLFHRFSQVHAASGKLNAGVGLGLSICLVYCKAMGGQIAVESEEGRGSTFTVTLPPEVRPTMTAHSPAPPDRTVPVAGPQASLPATDGPSTRPPAGADSANLVLIIDDDASIGELMQRNLDEEGFLARTAQTGAEGLRMAKQLLPSAIILDVVMPDLDGWAVLAALKSDPRTARIPIIMASMLDEHERGLKMGADEYVTKPFGRDRLVDLLHKHLGDRTRARLLVVEDEIETRDRLCRSLREQDWEVFAAGDGLEALRLLREHRPDLILLDLLLPVMHGFEVIEEVRKDPESREVPIVVMTAADLSAEDRRHLEGQVEQILQKGLYGRDEMLREIRALVREHQRRKSPPVQETVDG